MPVVGPNGIAYLLMTVTDPSLTGLGTEILVSRLDTKKLSINYMKTADKHDEGYRLFVPVYYGGSRAFREEQDLNFPEQKLPTRISVYSSDSLETPAEQQNHEFEGHAQVEEEDVNDEVGFDLELYEAVRQGAAAAAETNLNEAAAAWALLSGDSE